MFIGLYRQGPNRKIKHFYRQVHGGILGKLCRQVHDGWPVPFIIAGWMGLGGNGNRVVIFVRILHRILGIRRNNNTRWYFLWIL